MPADEEITLTENAVEVSWAKATQFICLELGFLLIQLGFGVQSPLVSRDRLQIWNVAALIHTSKYFGLQKLQELCQGQAEQCLRLTVEAGGCSGFSYKFDLDASVNEGDR